MANNMTELEKLQKLKNIGWKYNHVTGFITNHLGNINSSINKNGYSICAVNLGEVKFTVTAHRFAYWFYHNTIDNKLVIDHIDRNKLNNKIDNLRLITRQKNTFNTNAKGVFYDKLRKKYQSSIRVDGKLFFLGRFESQDDAREAYLEAKKIYHII